MSVILKSRKLQLWSCKEPSRGSDSCGGHRACELGNISWQAMRDDCYSDNSVTTVHSALLFFLFSFFNVLFIFCPFCLCSCLFCFTEAALLLALTSQEYWQFDHNPVITEGSAPLCLSVCLSVSVCLSLCLCLSVCLSVSLICLYRNAAVLLRD